jgi:hypothetical protein
MYEQYFHNNYYIIKKYDNSLTMSYDIVHQYKTTFTMYINEER